MKRHLAFVGIVGAVSVCASACAVSTEDVGSNTEQLCTSTTLSSDQPLNTASPGTQVTWTGAAGCNLGDTPEYEFWMKAPNQPYVLVQPYSTSTTYSWNTTSLQTGQYVFQVWVRAQGDTAAYEAYRTAYFQLQSGSPCTSMTAGFVPATTGAGVGDTLDLESTANCTSPEFEIWHLPPGGSYTLVQSYNASGTYYWDSTGQPTGLHNFQVWARAQGSTNAYEVYKSFTLNLYAPCTSLSTTQSPASPATIGTSVTITPSDGGTCGNGPEYEYWLQPPGGSYAVVQSYSSNPFVWNTTSLQAGTYQFQIWMRNKTNTTDYYETWTSFSYILQ